MQGTVTVIKTDGTVTEQQLQRVPTLAELSKAVGGYIEIVPYFNVWQGRPCVAFCNEEGKLHRLPMNRLAHIEWEKSMGKPITKDYLVGNIVICQGDRDFMSAI